MLRQRRRGIKPRPPRQTADRPPIEPIFGLPDPDRPVQVAQGDDLFLAVLLPDGRYVCVDVEEGDR